MGLAETFKIVIDVTTEGAQKSLKSLRKDVTDADGAFGKIKAAGSGSMTYLSEHAGAFALGAGTALVGFGIKAVGAFEDTAKAALDLGAATGLSTEAASRWIGVGDDFKVSAESLTASIGKIGKTLDGGTWEKYGIATRDAGGHARDTNAILVDAMAMLSSITNTTERARVGNALFGKGYKDLAPLIGHTKDQYDQMLGSVEKGQVITAAEAKKAEDMRLAQDKLHDALQEVTLAFGALAADAAPVVDGLASIITKTIDLKDKLNELPGPLKSLGSNLFELTGGLFKNAMDHWHKAFDDGKKKIEATTYSAEHLGLANQDLAQGAEKAAAELKVENDRLQSVADTADLARRRADNLTASWKAWKDGLTEQQSILDLQAGLDGLHEKAVAAWEAAATGSDNAAQLSRDYQSEQLKVTGMVGEFAAALGLVPKEVMPLVQAEIDNGSIATAEGVLNYLARTRQAKINATMDSIIVDGERHGLNGSITLPGFASGTSSAPAGPAWVGENGPEILNFKGGESVTPAGASAAIAASGFGASSQQPIVVQLVLNDRTVQEIMITSDRMKRSVM